MKKAGRQVMLRPEIDWEICQTCDPCEARRACKTRAIVKIDRDEPPYIELIPLQRLWRMRCDVHISGDYAQKWLAPPLIKIASNAHPTPRSPFFQAVPYPLANRKSWITRPGSPDRIQ